MDPEGSDVEVESIVDPDVELEQLKKRMTGTRDKETIQGVL